MEELELYAFNFNNDKCSLREVTLPESLKIIGIGAFWGCNTIAELTIPQSVEIIEKDAFYDWEDWQKFTFRLISKGQRTSKSGAKVATQKLYIIDKLPRNNLKYYLLRLI